jgi:hypothetical protein
MSRERKWILYNAPPEKYFEASPVQSGQFYPLIIPDKLINPNKFLNPKKHSQDVDRES